MSYRRARGHRVWHFSTNCQLWPLTDFETLNAAPVSGTLCSHCIRLSKVYSNEFKLLSLVRFRAVN
jgi:hypothetical protein